MSRLAKLASLALVLGILGQVAWAQVPFVRHRTPGLPPTVQLATLDTVASDFIRRHVPPGEPIIEVTPTHDIAALYYYFRLSAALVPRNAVWWAVPAPAPHVGDWWHDVSGGPSGIRRFAAAVGCNYLAFAGEPIPATLNVSRTWRMNEVFAVVELASTDERTPRSEA
ncbi:MAG: hypothetical protein J2P57_01285 [Acidimicrobiaceae bacterium]|nr:hypothetical protein [Acidimicrobiaceae bacterium]